MCSDYPAQPPPPGPPSFAKIEIYKDPDEFAEVDARAISVAQEDQKTFTDLVRQLVSGKSLYLLFCNIKDKTQCARLKFSSMS